MIKNFGNYNLCIIFSTNDNLLYIDIKNKTVNLTDDH